MEGQFNQEEVFIRGLYATHVQPIFNLRIDQHMSLLLALKSIVLVVSCFLFLFFSLSAMSTSFKAMVSEVETLKDMIRKIRETKWKGPKYVASYLMVLLSLSIVSLSLILLGLMSLVLDTLPIVDFLEFVLVPVCYMYVAALWMLSLVASVLETAPSDLVTAFAKAGEEVKGKVAVGYVCLLLWAKFLFLMSIFMAAKVSRGVWAGMGIVMLTVCLIWHAKLLKRILAQVQSSADNRDGLGLTEAVV